MPSRRRSSRSSSSSSSRQSSSAARITDEQINDLLRKLQATLLPHHPRPPRSTDVSAGRVLQEACGRISSLQREVDDLSERLAELLADSDDDVTGARAAALIGSLLS